MLVYLVEVINKDEMSRYTMGMAVLLNCNYEPSLGELRLDPGKHDL